AGWLAAAILLAAPSFLRTATWAYNDIALAFYATVALLLVLEARAQRSIRAFVLAGIFAGLAMGEKYTAAFVALALVALIARSPRATWRAALVFSISAGIVAAPWLIRNWIFVGNPVYPFVWGGREWDAFRAAWYSRFGTGLLNDPLRLLLAPWEATVWGHEDSPYFQATIGALLLALIPLGVLTARRGSTDVCAPRAWWWFVGMLYVVWLVGVAQSKLLWQTRLLFPAFPVLALLAGDAFERLARLELPQFSVQRFTMLVVGLVLALTAFSYALTLAGNSPFGYIAGFESRRAYLTRALGSYYAAAEFVNSALPKEARVLFLWETRPYYFERAVDEDAILDRWAHLRFCSGDADSIAAELRARGYTHVLLNRAGLDYILQAGYDPISPEDTRALEVFAARHLRPVYGETPLQIIARDGKPAVMNASNEPYAVYRLDAPR
ncbi:MAG: glycosyltransferase family 39 protein, partial [Chloroflexota bacterium]